MGVNIKMTEKMTDVGKRNGNHSILHIQRDIHRYIHTYACEYIRINIFFAPLRSCNTYTGIALVVSHHTTFLLLLTILKVLLFFQ